VLFLLIGLVACGGGGGGGGTSTGTLNLSMTDASSDQFQAIYVTISQVQVHVGGTAEGDWQVVLYPEHTYNLLELVNGVMTSLGSAALDAGSYDQLRLILNVDTADDGLNILGEQHLYPNYFIDQNGDSIPLKVPSGQQTGIKIVGGFDIVAGGATEVILDFDAGRSVVKAGNSGKWLLKPTIKILETVTNSISGHVDDGTLPVAESLVSAQQYDAGALDAAVSVVLQGSTLTDADGMYKMYLPPATYNVVAVKDGFDPACAVVDALGFQDHIQNFTLVAATGSGTITGMVSGLAGAEDSATISVRQMIDCGGGLVPVQVDSINVAEGGTFELSLPPGNYTLVASASGETTLSYDDVAVLDGQATPQDITFPSP